ncbi:MAG TPA: LysM peptidoglycan-binding domain-containing protein [bacterium]|jgi:hypothetical protein|nr:LysM peptidoglycan-binding domain-containing protein [bacterium]
MHALKNGLLFGSMFLVLVLLCPAAAPAAGTGTGAYTVAKGDCLWKIAARKDVFGDPWKWPLLFEANRGQISNPDLIQPGWSLAVMAAPTAAQVAQALAFARSYKEGAVQAPPGRKPETAAEAPPAAVAPAAAEPVVPAEEPKPSLVLPIASILLVLALVAGVVYRKMKQRPPEAMATAEPMPAHKEEVAPVNAAAQAEAAAPVETPAPAQEPEVEKAPDAVQPTESETMLRADQGPDPLHPESHSEDHKNAA